MAGSKLQKHRDVLQNPGNKLQDGENNLKNLGEGMIFMETFRKNGTAGRFVENMLFYIEDVS